ncbi:hypothetical protein D9619_006901 [Psilocybe cf. subviscida]|uniref:Uncharacterized protein n=1 Tax=Psilocybe cf. subviscida TaxID=2480587 RepID=A0A8H5B3V8_9AGAR|nr:hypothetical protein D9619_006901 [Psilocybe cf. subviscida]
MNVDLRPRLSLHEIHSLIDYYLGHQRERGHGQFQGWKCRKFEESEDYDQADYKYDDGSALVLELEYFSSCFSIDSRSTLASHEHSAMPASASAPAAITIVVAPPMPVATVDTGVDGLDAVASPQQSQQVQQMQHFPSFQQTLQELYTELFEDGVENAEVVVVEDGTNEWALQEGEAPHAPCVVPLLLPVVGVPVIHAKDKDTNAEAEGDKENRNPLDATTQSEAEYTHFIMPTLQPKTTKQEKKAALEERARRRADSHTEIVEEGRVFCGPCKKWLALQKNSRYHVSQWSVHRKCGEHARCVNQNMLAGAQGEAQHNEATGEQNGNLRCMRPRLAHPKERTEWIRNPTQREERLPTDPYAGEVHEYQVFCRLCEKWIASDSRRQYDLTKWFQHKGSQSHALMAAGEQRRRASAHTAHPPAQFEDSPNPRQDPDSENDYSSNASSPSVYYTPLMNFPVPKSLPSPMDPYEIVSIRIRRAAYCRCL